VSGDPALSIVRESGGAGNRRLLEALTTRLPQWFAQSEPNRHYARQAEVLDGWVARVAGRPCGLLLLGRHNAVSAEIHWLGVEPDQHRHGVGRALVGAIEQQLRTERAKYLFVQTLHPDVDYEPYRRTRAFYEALGFEMVLPSDRGPTGASSDALAYYLRTLA
jgi:GNAT superfamily N-acetyltransferase